MTVKSLDDEMISVLEQVVVLALQIITKLERRAAFVIKSFQLDAFELPVSYAVDLAQNVRVVRHLDTALHSDFNSFIVSVATLDLFRARLDERFELHSSTESGRLARFVEISPDLF